MGNPVYIVSGQGRSGPITSSFCLSLLHQSVLAKHLFLLGKLGAQLGNFARGAQVYLYIYIRKEEIIHGLTPSVKCVAPLFRDMSLQQSI